MQQKINCATNKVSLSPFVSSKFNDWCGFTIGKDLIVSFEIIKLHPEVIWFESHEFCDVGNAAAGLLVIGKAVRVAVIGAGVETSETERKT